MTTVELQAKREILLAAMFAGRLRVRFADGREVQYQTISQMKEALALLDEEISVAGASRRRIRQRRVTGVKGY